MDYTTVLFVIFVAGWLTSISSVSNVLPEYYGYSGQAATHHDHMALINVVFIQSHMAVTDSTHTIVSPRLRWSAAMDSNTDAKVEV